MLLEREIRRLVADAANRQQGHGHLVVPLVRRFFVGVGVSVAATGWPAVGFVGSGALIMEIVFSYPGIGLLLLGAVSNTNLCGGSNNAAALSTVL